MSFNVAISGLNAAQADLSVTANNIANNSTTGFKGSRTQFSELFSVSATNVATVATGSGVRIGDIKQQFGQGNIDFTENNLDMALSGPGFFIVNEGGALSYTRAGAFQMDGQGYVVNSSAQRLQIYPPLPQGGFNTGALSDLRLVNSESPPAATGNVELIANLPASAAVPPNAPFSAADPDSYSHASAMTVYDSLGAAHTATVYFVKDAAPHQWQQHLFIDGNAVGTPQPLQFTSSGTLAAPAGGVVSFPPYTPATGAAPITLNYDFEKATQFGNSFSVSSITQDGYTTGRLVGIDTGSDGIIQARFTNGRSIQLGQVALAQFSNPNGLQQLADTSWAETADSGQALRGQAGNSGLGLVQAGALEASNVDITEQLVSMITAQRNFQANAQMISTTDAITQTIINIR
jgi:flagellar hook protein FlgE